MPYAILPADGGFKVVNTSSGKVHAEHATKENAEAQVRLLRGIEHGMTPRKSKRSLKTDHMGTTQPPTSADAVSGPPVPLKRLRA